MNSTICVSMLVLAGSLAAARPASACTVMSPYPGLTIEPGEDHWITGDGVIMVRGEAYTVDVDTALADLALWEVRGDGVVLPGEFEVVPLWDRAATTARSEDHVFALIWRADAPLSPGGTYTLDFAVAGPYGSAPEQLPLTVINAVEPMLPEVAARAETVLVDATEVVCCESSQDSCGDSRYCETIAATQLPAIAVEVESNGASYWQQVVWVAQVLPGGEIGPHLQPKYSFRASPWEWSGTLMFDAPAEQYCFVTGATSARDGSEVVSDPVCLDQAELDVPRSVQLEPSARMAPREPDVAGEGKCIGPIVYEADGAAYPRGSEPEPASRGCNVAPRSPAWLVLLALVRRRRSRA
jgi:hypothetical protein